VAAGAVKPDAGREVLVPIVEHHVIGIKAADQLGHRLAIKRGTRHIVAHVAAGGEGHFRVLHVEAGIGKRADRSGMIVMQVSEDHVFD
jgi:hypothetical protein